MPPSAITGTSCRAAACAHSWIAVICGTPTPATTRVVQIEPGPTPDLDAVRAERRSALRRPRRVAMLPAMTRPRSASLSLRTMVMTFSRVAVGRVDDEHVDARLDQRGRRARVRPGRRRRRRRRAGGRASPWSRSGARCFLAMSFTVISPRRLPSASTTGSFSILLRCRISSACSSVVPGGAVTRLRVGHQLRDAAGRVLLEAQVAVREDADEPAVLVGDRHAGDAVVAPSARAPRETSASGRQRRPGRRSCPASERFTRSTSPTCSAIERFRWRTPRPPSRAMAIGHARLRHRVHRGRDDRDGERQLARQPGRGRDVVGQDVRLGGTSRTSSKVRPSRANLSSSDEEPLDPSDFDLRQLAIYVTTGG